MDDLIFLENQLCDMSNNSIGSLKELIKNKYMYMKEDIFYFLVDLAKIRSLYFNLIMELIKLVMPENPIVSHSSFTYYLMENGLLKGENFVISSSPMNFNKTELPFSEDSIGYSIMNDDVSSFSSFLCDFNELEFDVDYKSKDRKETVLELAAHSGSVKIFKYLMLNGMKLNEKIPNFAIKGGNTEILQILLQNGFSFQNYLLKAVKYHRNDAAQWILQSYNLNPDKLGPFCLAHRNLSLFIENGYDFNERDFANRNSLMISVEKRNLELTKFLIKKFDINEFDNFGLTALMIACNNGNLNLVKYLIDNGADVNIKSETGYKSLLFNKGMNDETHNLSKYIKENEMTMDSLGYDGTTALLCAANCGYADICKYLIEKGCEINCYDSHRKNALLHAVSMRNVELTKILIENGIDLDFQDIAGKTALHYTALVNDVEIGKMLIMSGANPRIVDAHGDIPVTVAARSESREWVDEICNCIMELRKRNKL